jgi:uncharacterized RDD family membrane protein YckC
MSTFVPPITGDPLSPAVPARPARRVGALWRRVLAFFIDTIIIGFPVEVVAWIFFDKFSQLGAWGRLVGFCLALPYFAILDSSIGNGQTLGKRWMHVRVVDGDGNPIPFGKALLRYVVFAVPWFLNEISLPANGTSAAVSTLIALIIFGVGGTTLYLMCFNRRTRQGLHDLMVGSHVADADVPGPVSVQPIWKMHWAIIGAMIVVISVAGVVLAKKANGWGAMSELLDDMRVVQALPGVQSVGAAATTVWGGSSRHVLEIKVFWTGRSEAEGFANSVASAVLMHDPAAQKYDSLRISLIRQFDLGIASGHVTSSYQHTLAEWNARLAKASGQDKNTT